MLFDQLLNFWTRQHVRNALECVECDTPENVFRMRGNFFSLAGDFPEIFYNIPENF